MPRSSAYGYAQALEGTWDDYRADTGRRGADRDDFADSSDFIGWYMAGASRVNGLPPHDTYNHYLAYHEGKAGYARGSYRAKSWLPAGRPRRRGLGGALRRAAPELSGASLTARSLVRRTRASVGAEGTVR